MDLWWFFSQHNPSGANLNPEPSNPAKQNNFRISSSTTPESGRALAKMAIKTSTLFSLPTNPSSPLVQKELENLGARD
jgi:hypothetical protein